MSYLNQFHYSVDHIPPQVVPPEIITARDLLIASAQENNSEIRLQFDPHSYRPLDEIPDTNGNSIVFGSLDGTPASISNERRAQAMAIADWVGEAGVLHMKRFDHASENFCPVTVEVQSSSLPGFLVHMPRANLSCGKGKAPSNAFTTGWRLAEVGGAVVSFVGYSEDDSSYSLFGTATEIAQNRLGVTAVTTDDGRRFTERNMTHPYQEVVANTVGEMCTWIMAGHDFQLYRNALATMETALIRGDSEGLCLLAPHHIFPKRIYDQVAAGKVPTGEPRLLPIHPGTSA